MHVLKGYPCQRTNGTGCGDVRERGGQQGWGCAWVQGERDGMAWMDNVQVCRPDIWIWKNGLVLRSRPNNSKT